MKHDTGKRRYDLISAGALGLIADVFTFGAVKHDRPRAKLPGYLTLPRAREIYTRALFRHWEDWRAGKIVDSESKLPTLAHVAANAIILLTLEIRAKKD